MSFQAVCHMCGSLSHGVSPLCKNQLCANFGQPARPQFEPTDSGRASDPHKDRQSLSGKQIGLRTLVLTTTVVAGVLALIVNIPIVGFLLLASAGLGLTPLLFIRWNQWLDARPRLKLLEMCFLLIDSI